MRVGEFWEAIIEYRRNQSDDRRHIAELVRGCTMKLWNLQVEKRYRQEKPNKFWPLPWDEDDEMDEAREEERLASLTPEQQQEEVRKFLERTSHGRSKSKP